MINFIVSELWHDKTRLQIVGLKVGDFIRVIEERKESDQILAAGNLSNPTDLANVIIPIGFSELERFYAVTLEWYSSDVRHRFNVAEKVLLFNKNLRLLHTGFQKIRAETVRSVAVVTIALDEEFMLRRWTNYYGRLFGHENLFVIDDGSSINPRDYLDNKVNVIRQPRTAFNSWRLCRSLSKLQRFLLETYDAVIVVDSDEFIISNRSDCTDLMEHIQLIAPGKSGIIKTVGWELIHLIDREPVINPDLPISRQRKYLFRNNGFDKPALTTSEISLTIGNHMCFEESTQDSDLIMLHLRHFDFNFSLEKIRKYKATSWAQIDLANGFSNHQRIEESELLTQFNEHIRTFQEFERAGDSTKVKLLPPHWENQLLWAD